MESFSRDKRLLTKQDYEQVFKQAKKIAMPAFFVLAKLNDKNCARLGFALAKKALRKAHQRNRIKRLFRESFRKHCVELNPVDLVVLAKSHLVQMTNQEIQADLEKLWQKVSMK